MKNYAKKSTFASFLPGIAGIKGIPIWCHYVNRGQAVTSFGSKDKNGSIMEFSPAHTAYQTVKRNGFRTFIKKDGKVYEPFHDENVPHEMTVRMNTLTIKEECGETGLTTEITYYVLPEEELGALVREVNITNHSRTEAHIEIADGMPALVPYGISMTDLKNMLETAKAWMQEEATPAGNAYYRVRASLEDSAAVREIKEGNFALCFEKSGEKIYPVVDPQVIFAYDNSFENPVNFKESGIKGIKEYKERHANLFPAAFFLKDAELKAGETLSFYEVYGFAESMEKLDKYAGEYRGGEYFTLKKARARELTDNLTEAIGTHTADARFDEYCRYTFMDNCLRGGAPIRLGNNKVFYVYSRKHGDTERDYNFFSVLPEFYSQGNASYRDINQNRRMDAFFAPFTDKENIKEFYSLIQLDGYNPLGIEKLTYRLPADKAEALLSELSPENAEEVKNLVTGEYTPGALYSLLLKVCDESLVEDTFTSVIDFSDCLVNGNFGEGYWCDHWTYNLDLVNEYLGVFPEKEHCLLYKENLTYYKPEAKVRKRFNRYVKTANGIRQYNALDVLPTEKGGDKIVRTGHGKGEALKVSLMEKLVLLSAVKFATLDFYGMGIEMEGGKPGWYDALNGLPGLFGSSVGETCELARNLHFTLNALNKYKEDLSLTKEVAGLLRQVGAVAKKEQDPFRRWTLLNDIKEDYREKIYEGISGEKETVEYTEARELLENIYKCVRFGIEKALKYGDGICPMYFSYDVTAYEEKDGLIIPLDVAIRPLPAFLEGQVHYLKLPETKERKQVLYNEVKTGDLYDKPLSMYKVNASLKDASYEVGRAKAFTPGWLENESIWLHMEYKYLLELIKSGLYKEFFEDFKTAAIPFLDEEKYGRSTMENSSFLASSVNPDASIHGKGFVARLSGSTVEFMNMWKLMMFGKNPFRYEKDALSLHFEPAIPRYLIGADKRVEAMFLGNIPVTYLFDKEEDYIPGDYTVAGMKLTYKNNTLINVYSDTLEADAAADVRDGKVKSLEITLVKK